jgi:glycosyltransferase involved in cell wall biosynthesis
MRASPRPPTGAPRAAPISAAVITLDAARTLEESLASLAFCDEIVVLDSGSTDETLEIARAHGARVAHRDWSGFRDQKNAATALCARDWVLSIDADEVVTPELAREIADLFADGSGGNPGPAAVGYSIPRRTRYLGRDIRHAGWYPDRAVRLYDRRSAEWVGGQVHERVVVDGPVERLSGDLLHHPYATLAHHLDKLNRYSTLAAHTLHSRGRRAGWSDIAFRPPLAFIKKMLPQRGILDGVPGLVVALSTATSVFLKYAKLWDLARRDVPRDPAAAADRSDLDAEPG